MRPEDLVIEELCSLDEQMNIYSIEDSAPIISKFGSHFIHDSLLKVISNELWQERNDTYAPLHQILKKLSRKLFPICIAVNKYISENNITAPIITNELHHLKYRQENNSNTFYMQLLALNRIFKALLYDPYKDHRNFIKQYAVIDESNYLKPVSLLINTEELEEELFNLERTAKTSVWYALNQIISFHTIYDPKVYQYKKNILRKQHPCNELILIVQYEALKRSIGSTKNPNYAETSFDPKKFKGYIHLLCLHVKKKFYSNNISTVDPIVAPAWNFDSNTGIFSGPKGDATFRTYRVPEDKKRINYKGRAGYGYPREVLAYITKDKKNKEMIWSHSNLYDSIVGPNPEKDCGKTMYDTCMHINARLLSKCGLENFLIITMDFVQINPKYLN